LYYNSRVLINTVNEDSGCYLRDVLKSCQIYGICKEDLWPYDIAKWKDKPSKPSYDDAMNFKITKYASLSDGNIQEACAMLCKGLPVIFGMYCYPELTSPQIMVDGILTMPSPEEKWDGGHAVCCHPDTIVLTKQGNKKIVDVVVGDEVLTHLRRFRKVTKIMNRDINEEICVIKNYYGDDIKVTKEHPFYSKTYNESCQTALDYMKNTQWQKAEDLKEGDLLYHPIYTATEQPKIKHKGIYCNNYLIYKLDKKPLREFYNGKVYNLEVEEDNSYTANGIAVHNCLVGFDTEKKYFKVINRNTNTKWLEIF
jgi:hypothetical protein